MDENQSIPGTTEPDDVSDLLIEDRSLRAIYEAELQNILKPMTKYLATRPSRRTAPFTLSWVIRLHREMFGDVHRLAGVLRRTEKNLGVRPCDIEPQLQALLGDLACWTETGMDLLEQAALLHYRAVWIHPFNDGNGRWARLLANVWFKVNGHAPTNWPAETRDFRTSVVRKEYIAAIQAADDGDMGPLLEMHRRYTR
jgi:fido (protein-threonine AMPylation protein)